MKKTFLLTLSLFNTCFIVYTQPEFQMKLYGKDTLGNIDSLIVGYDKGETAGDLNPAFGEFVIETPFDSIFEMRAISTFDWELRQSKVMIGGYEGDCEPFGASEAIGILVRAKHLPITISWDKELLNTGTDTWCRSETFLTNTPGIFFVENMYIFDIIWMNQQDSYTENFDKPDYGYNPVMEEVEGIGKDTVWRFFLVFRTNTWRTSTAEAAPLELQNPYPNPCDSELNIDIPDQIQIKIVSVLNIAGAQQFPRFSQTGNTIRIQTHGLSRGIYFLLLSDKEGKRYFTRFVKG